MVKDLGEQGLLKLIQSYCPTGVVGDDAAVLNISPGYKLVVTTDVLVDKVHFSDRTTTAFDVGWRSAAANLSDLAAMGASPVGITVGLSLPGETPVSWVEELYEGLCACLQQFQIPIVGGDITRSEVITVAITALGEVLPRQVITRSGAKPGDAILVTGYHGLSKAGLELLLDPRLKAALTPEERALAIEAHQRPQPRLDVVARLRQIDPKAEITGMDSSDGLGDAIAQICGCSKVGATVDLNSIPQCAPLEKLRPNYPIEEWILDGGENFELVLCLVPKLASKLLSYLEGGAAIIGHITEQPQIKISGRENTLLRNVADLSHGFQHFFSGSKT